MLWPKTGMADASTSAHLLRCAVCVCVSRLLKCAVCECVLPLDVNVRMGVGMGMSGGVDMSVGVVGGGVLRYG